MKGYTLPQGMLLGVAMSAAQTEGGVVDSSWNYWYRKGRIRDGSDITVADDHWNRWKSDADLLLALGVQTVRVSVDWTRMQPEPGTVDKAAVAHYRKELEYLTSHGIRPLLTIHHFSDPMWFMERGGFMKPENAKHYLHFVGLVVRAFGDLVSDYVTFNEPNYYAVAAYGGLGFPPGDDNIVTVRRVMSVMAGCHIRAYEKIHRMREKMGYDDTHVGVALNAQIFAAVNPFSFVESRSALLGQAVFQTRPAEAFLKGEFHFPMQNLGGFEKGVYADFIGIDYFTRTHCKRPGDDITREYDAKDDIRHEIYPQGLEECMQALTQILDRPIWITANGVADNKDKFHSLYLYDQLAVLAATKVPVERYYHWTFLDDFEWLEGTSKRFGLVHVDFETQERTVKKSGHFYREIIRNHGVTEDMIGRYLTDERYHR